MPQKKRSAPCPHTYGWILWGLAALFYGFEFTARIAPAVFSATLVERFGISAHTLGHISGAYYYAYALMQIPSGFICDHFRIERVLTGATCLFLLGQVLFTQADSIVSFQISRALIGVGSSFGFIACLKIATQWHPKSRFPFLVGFTNFFGVLGALYAGAPLAHMLDTHGWVYANQGLTMVAALFPLIFLMLSIRPGCPSNAPLPDPISVHWRVWWPEFRIQMIQLFTHRRFLGYCLYAACIVAPIAGFPELWGVVFLEKAYALSHDQAALFNSLIFCGIAIGGPTLGAIVSMNPRSVEIFLRYCSMACMAGLAMILFPNPVSQCFLPIFLLIYGFLSAHMLMCFSLARDLFPGHHAGFVIAVMNMAITLFSTLFQPTIGGLVDMLHRSNWLPSSMIYQIALCILFLPLLLALYVGHRLSASPTAS